ncbi:MAG: hypothetical protein IPN94_25620 [Sphingobacteriales bacterium]|nr:hypothetical protein [Sphingobacteriales bacterium]
MQALCNNNAPIVKAQPTLPTITGTSGGTFSATGEAVINPLTGEFDTTIHGTFTVRIVTVVQQANHTFVVTIVPSIVYCY